RGQHRHSAADLLDLRTERLRAVRAVRVVDRDVRALSRELARDPVADARSAAGDERAAAGERKTHRRFAPIRIRLSSQGLRPCHPGYGPTQMPSVTEEIQVHRTPRMRGDDRLVERNAETRRGRERERAVDDIRDATGRLLHERRGEVVEV